MSIKREIQDDSTKPDPTLTAWKQDHSKYLGSNIAKPVTLASNKKPPSYTLSLEDPLGNYYSIEEIIFIPNSERTPKNTKIPLQMYKMHLQIRYNLKSYL